MFSKVITSARLILRPYEAGDLPSWQIWDMDPAVQAFMPETGKKPPRPEDQITYFKACRDSSDGYYWSVVWKNNNTPIGTVSLERINTHYGTAEFSIMIGEKEYWRKGVAAEATKMILKFSPDLGLRRLSAEFEEGNVGMEKVLTELGFQKEAVFPASRIKNGYPVNTVRYYKLV
jgi:RimJ/RimL family protein N-acetyltransferase